MRKIISVAAAATLALSPVAVDAKGCIRGAFAGGVAGHYVGKGHAFAGAAAGCIAMHHYYANKAKQQAAAARAQVASH